jgi:hypothetical protein
MDQYYRGLDFVSTIVSTDNADTVLDFETTIIVTGFVGVPDMHPSD